MDRRILEPGWAGLLTMEEAEFIAHSLVQDSTLRRKPGTRKCRPLELWHPKGRAPCGSTTVGNQQKWDASRAEISGIG